MARMSKYAAATAAAATDSFLVIQGGKTLKVTGEQLKAIFGEYVKNNFAGTAPPSATDDASAGYSVGSAWLDATASPMELYRCAVATAGAAVWLKTTLTLDELGTGALRNIEAGTAENDMLFAGATPFSWVKKTLAQAKALLGLGGSVPAPTAANDVIMAEGSPLDWVKKTAAECFAAIKQAATTLATGVARVATDAETATGSSADTIVPPSGLKFRHDSEAENESSQIQYPIPTSGYILQAAADGSPAVGANTNADVADAVSKKHAQNTDTGTTATSFKINSSGNEADLQTTGLTGDRDFTVPDIDTMLAGAVATAENGAELINFTTAALETQLTSITHTAPGVPDYAIQDLIDSGVGSAFGFASKDEGNTVLKVILNLQTRMAALETELKAIKLLA